MKKIDYIIKDDTYTDLKTGVEIINNRMFTVWADEEMKSVIEGVEGVLETYNTFNKNEFSVYFDIRYNREEIKQEVAKAIMEKVG